MKVTRNVQVILAAIFGIVFLSVILVIAITIPNPSQFQYLVFRITLALAAGGVAALIPGILNVRIGRFITAGGALAVFVIVYFYNPSHKIIESSEKILDQTELLRQRDEAKNLLNIQVERYSVGITDLSDVITANNSVLKLELELSSNSKDLVSVYKAALDRATKMKNRIDTLVLIGARGKIDLMEINSYCTEISNELTKVKANLDQ